MPPTQLPDIDLLGPRGARSPSRTSCAGHLRLLGTSIAGSTMTTDRNKISETFPLNETTSSVYREFNKARSETLPLLPMATVITTGVTATGVSSTTAATVSTTEVSTTTTAAISTAVIPD